jgi:CspA family cold shock protein
VQTGTVKWWNDTKGYGFIVPEEGGKDVFVHFTGIEAAGAEGRRSLAQGQRVSYEITDGAKGPQATAVVPS